MGKKCKHNKQRCRECTPQYFCRHSRQKQVCKECKIGYCDHGKVKSQCILCNPNKFCRHAKRRTLCKECGGGSICVHNKRRSTCDLCSKGIAKCKHGIREKNCKYCGKKCKHDRRMSTWCRPCKRQICVHNTYNFRCKICNPDQYYSMILRSRLSKIWSRKQFTKSKKTIELLGCDMDTFKAHIKKQFKKGMTWDNHGKWHFDHIKPLLHDNPDQKEMERRMHYTNIQPLWASENTKKGNRYIG